MPTDADRTPSPGFSGSLALVGWYILSFGTLEATVCRVVEYLERDAPPGHIGDTRRLHWEALVKRLRAAGEAHGIPEVAAILEEHDVGGCTSLRHSLVHGVADFNRPPAVTIVRRWRDGSDGVLVRTWADLAAAGDNVVGMTRQLDLLLPQDHRRLTSNMPGGAISPSDLLRWEPPGSAE